MSLTRRHFLTTTLAAGAAVALPALPASALTQGEARGLIDGLVAEINTVIASGKSERAMYTDFERIFRKYGDIPYIAAYAMGNDGRRATNAQKKAFSNAFTGYISRKYGKRFREFIGGRLEVNGSSTGRNAFLVSTTAYLRNEAPFEVTFHVGQSSGKMFNIFIDGVNMLLTERTEIGALLDRNRGDIDRMIAQLATSG